MMTLTGSRDRTKALPAGIRTAFQPTTYYQGLARLNSNADVVQQGGGVHGFAGLGDQCYDDTSDSYYDCGDTTGGDTSSTGLTQANTPLTTAQVAQLEASNWATPSTNVPTGAATTGGQSLNAQQIAQLISAAATSATSIYKGTQSPFLVPGTNVIYNPATGALSNGSGINLSSILGTASVTGTTGISGTTVLLIGGLGLLGLMVMGRR
jgi:hypothetical protein